jgi:hypothetical protein
MSFRDVRIYLSHTTRVSEYKEVLTEILRWMLGKQVMRKQGVWTVPSQVCDT